MKKAAKVIGRFLLLLALTFVLDLGIKIAMDGCWLVFRPIDDKVQSVTIEYPSLTQTAKEITEPTELKQCVNLLNMLNYDVFRKSEDETGALVTYTYHLKDGTDLVVAANNETVFYKGKQHVLKQQKLFINLTEGLFFQQEAAQ